MKLGRIGSALLVSGIVVACGGGGGLEGTWSYNAMLTDVGPIDVTFNGDGTVTYKVTANGSCSGTATLTGYLWKSTATTVTIAGNPTCKGTVTCTILGIKTSTDCSSKPPTVFSGTCDYMLSSDGNTLTVDQCSGTTGPIDGGGGGASTAYTLKRSS